MKKISVILILLLVLGVLAGCSNDMLKNSETGNYGPAWDVTMKLPAVDSQNNFGDLVGATEFEKFGFNVIENSGGDNQLEFFIVGTESKPITKTLKADLPYLKVTRDDPLFTFDTQTENLDPIPVIPGEEITEPLPIPFPLPGVKFASSTSDGENDFGITVTNVGDNTLDSFTVVLKTKDGRELNQVTFNSLSGEATQYIDLSNKTIDTDQLKMYFSHNQSGDVTNSTQTHIKIDGPENMTIVEVNNLEKSSIELGDALNTEIDLGNLAEVNYEDKNNNGIKDSDEYAKIDLKIESRESSNLIFDFDSGSNNIKLGTTELNYDSGVYSTGEKSKVSLSSLTLNGGVEVEGDTFSYNANDKLSITTSIVGENTVPVDQFIDPEEFPFEVEGNNLVYKMEGAQVEVTQEQVDKINKHILSEETYLKTDINNALPVGLKADIYLASSNNSEISKENLYVEDNKVNKNSVIEISGSDIGDSISKSNKFVLGDIKNEDGSSEEGMITKIENAVENGENIFIGFKFNIGDIENSDDFNDENEKSYSFSDDQTIDTKAHIGVTVKVNQ